MRLTPTAHNFHSHCNQKCTSIDRNTAQRTNDLQPLRTHPRPREQGENAYAPPRQSGAVLAALTVRVAHHKLSPHQRCTTRDWRGSQRPKPSSFAFGLYRTEPYDANRGSVSGCFLRAVSFASCWPCRLLRCCRGCARLPRALHALLRHFGARERSGRMMPRVCLCVFWCQCALVREARCCTSSVRTSSRGSCGSVLLEHLPS